MKKIQFTDGIENLCAIQKLVGGAVWLNNTATDNAVLCALDGKLIAHLGDYIVKDKGKIYVTKD
jgi:hypothetical protein